MISKLVDTFSQALAAVRSLKEEGIVSEYAVGGAMALAFWSEPLATFDLDVFVLMQSRGALISLEGIYSWARGRGFEEVSEHILVAGLPVQFIPAPNQLAEEAITKAAELDYDGEPVRVIRPEYLVAMALEPSARTPKRMARVAALLEAEGLDRALLGDLLARYGLELPRP